MACMFLSILICASLMSPITPSSCSLCLSSLTVSFKLSTNSIVSVFSKCIEGGMLKAMLPSSIFERISSILDEGDKAGLGELAGLTPEVGDAWGVGLGVGFGVGAVLGTGDGALVG